MIWNVPVDMTGSQKTFQRLVSLNNIYPGSGLIHIDINPELPLG